MSTKGPINLFIDTNIFLGFYAFTNDDIEQLKQLVDLIKTKSLRLFLTSQVEDEFYRNREKKLSESIKQFDAGPVPKSIPRFMSEYDLADEYKTACEKVQQFKGKLSYIAREDALKQNFAADGLFKSLIEATNSLGTFLSTSPTVFDAARQRMLLGNPPGKSESLGDRVNWELLLDGVQDHSTLHIISKDGDFESSLHKGIAHDFLLREWRQRKHGELEFHAELRPFLNKNLPDIELPVDTEKREAIDRLIYSGNFANTHSAVAELRQYMSLFTKEELAELLEAADANSQIGWIIADSDVESFYTAIIAAAASNAALPQARLEYFRDLFGMSEEGKNSDVAPAT